MPTETCLHHSMSDQAVPLNRRTRVCPYNNSNAAWHQLWMNNQPTCCSQAAWGSWWWRIRSGQHICLSMFQREISLFFSHCGSKDSAITWYSNSFCSLRFIYQNLVNRKLEGNEAYIFSPQNFQNSWFVTMCYYNKVSWYYDLNLKNLPNSLTGLTSNFSGQL